MKRRILLGFGPALLIFSPLWLTLAEPRSYFNFGISFVLGILLLILGLRENTPKVIATIHDSIKLARLVLRTLNAG